MNPKKLLNYFLNGLLLSVPLVVVLYVVYQLFIFMDDLILPFLNSGREPEDYRFRGFGFVILIALLTTVGYFGNTLIAKPIKRSINRLIDRVPLLKTIYDAVADLLSAFVGKKKRFNQPVLVKISKDSDLQKIGFITDANLTQLGDIRGKVAVYFPHSYAFSGNLFIVPIENVKPLDKNPADVIKYIVSGGVSDMEENDEE
jgi:uncharacterized membrane protein